MIKAVKSYLAFSSLSYRIACTVVIPVLMLAGTAFMIEVTGECNGIFPEYILFSYAVGFEVISDYWMLGGICSRAGNGLEYVKTSKAGVATLQKCVAVDLLRRFVYLMGFGLFCFAFTGEAQEFVTALAAYLVVTAVLNLTRHFVLWQLQMLVCCLAAAVFAGAAVLFWMLGQGALIAELVILGVAAAAVSAATVWHMGYCMKRSYHEK